MPSSDTPTTPPATGGRKRALFFLLSMSPVIALIALLAWGQLRPESNPGGLLEHEQPGAERTSVRAAPDLAGFDLVSGAQVSLESLRGKVVVVDFWSSWCAACRAEAADLATVYLEYIDAPVEFVGVAIWDATGDVLQHIERYGVTYPNILDERGAAAVGYGVRGVPEKFFLDGDGQIVLKLIGPVSDEKLRETIDSLLVAQRDG